MSGQATKLTVCLPVYNAMPYVAETLVSLLDQTVSNFDVLIIDDGSTDDTLAYLQSFQKTHPGPRFTILSQPNRGLTVTLNRMLEMLGTGWMVRQDADDIALPNRIEKLQEAMQQFPRAGMIYSHVAHWQRGSSQGLLLATPTGSTGLRAFLEKGYLPAICHPSIALRVEAALEVGGYRFDHDIEDYDLYWRMGLKFHAHMIPDVLLGYRMTANSISDKNSRKQATNILYVQYLLLSELWGKESLPYEQVIPTLEKMVDRRHVSFRRHMRSALVRYGSRRYVGFAVEVTRAFLASPTSFLARFLRKNEQIARIGVAPELFRRHQKQLWPNSEAFREVAAHLPDSPRLET